MEMKKSLLFYLQFTVLLLLLFSNVGVIADDDEDDDEDTFEIEQSGDKIKIKYEYEIENDGVEYEIEHEVEVDIHAGRGLTVEVEYEEGDEDENFSVGEELEIKVEYLSLSEYTDVNNNDVYNPDNDVLVQTIYLYQLNFNLTVISVVENNVTTYEITAIGSFGAFEFGIIVYVQEITTANLDINHVKIDIIINNFPFQTNDGKILLIAELDSFSKNKSFEKENENEDEDDHAVEMDHPLGTGEYIVDPQANIDSTDKAVSVYDTLAVDGESAYSYSSYPHGDKILHDPILGVLPKKTTTVVNNADNFVNDKKKDIVSNLEEANSFSVFVLSLSLIARYSLRRKLI